MSGEYFARLAPSNEWPTPDHVYQGLNDEFGFTVDVAASDEHHKCERYFTLADDGLAQEWDGVVWCNPPYGRVIAQWVAKAHATSLAGATVVMLIPSRTDTAWWHDYVLAGGAEVRFIRGRLNFGPKKTKKHSAPFPSAVVIFRPTAQAPRTGYPRPGASASTTDKEGVCVPATGRNRVVAEQPDERFAGAAPSTSHLDLSVRALLSVDQQIPHQGRAPSSTNPMNDETAPRS